MYRFTFASYSEVIELYAKNTPDGDAQMPGREWTGMNACKNRSRGAAFPLAFLVRRELSRCRRLPVPGLELVESSVCFLS
jgi:hypothetical protein